MTNCPYCHSGTAPRGYNHLPYKCPDCDGTGRIRCEACGADLQHYSSEACVGCDVGVCRHCVSDDGYCEKCEEERE